MEQINFWISIIATMAFAITGVLAISNRGVDLFGVLVLGLITAIGGGTIRDIILETPIFWSENQVYVWLALGASVLTFFAESFFTQPQIYRSMLYLDGFGAALFAIGGTDKAWNMDFGQPVAPVIMGVVTAIGGGLLRDVLAGRKTLLMSDELYAIPVSFGCIAYVLILNYCPQYTVEGSVICMLSIFGLRAAAIHWDLRVPKMFITKTR
ncbi:trimeric intracellular cation channel family protein [Polynucleobacter sp. 15G-AUS-farblos]|uniref:trimeric intracellular cation channel family protein n=1 Tax=Polynucleobacter sp. 15G-AUS-farblos TaxID=2689094 RepID=UPI001C0D445E|nr:trimeric intracellular cation channel family protein [Polynucleobacter sp. 15G-AUS-farblos]MBU3583502.1 trimeric intracellular cation channel family protein [Polynucleobacter sp. 15G-AUS-farblos]